jgi:hypothetical protein
MNTKKSRKFPPKGPSEKTPVRSLTQGAAGGAARGRVIWLLLGLLLLAT